MRRRGPRTTAGELQKIVESRGQKTLKKNQTASTSRVIWEGFKKNYLSSSKNKLQHIQLSDTTGTSNGTGFYRQMKIKKNSFLAANTQDGFGEHRDKKYPMCTIKYTAVFLCCGPKFLLEVLDILFRHMASWITSNTNINTKINK